MYQSNNRNVRGASNYAEALSIWSNIKPWRGSYDRNVRPVGARTHKRKVIYKGVDGSIIYKFHNTDMLRFYPDGRLDVHVGYVSMTTQQFLNSALRGPIHIQLHNNGSVVWHGSPWYSNAAGYKVEGATAHFDVDRNLLNPKPIMSKTMDRVVSKQVRDKYRWSEFKPWRDAYAALVGLKTHGEMSWQEKRAYNQWSSSDVREALLGTHEEWKDLVANNSVERILEMIYDGHPEIVKSTERGPFTSYADHKAWNDRENKYR